MRIFDEVVIGGGLGALIYAYCNDKVLIRAQSGGPPLFDFFDPGIDLTAFFFQPATFELKSNAGIKTVGMPKRDLWERLSFMLSIGGNLPFSDKVKSIRIDCDQKTVSVAAGNTTTKIGFVTLRVFDDIEVHGLESHILSDFEKVDFAKFLSPKKFKILDWLDVRSGCRHEFDYLCTDDDFVNELYFYPSERVDGNHDLKDLVAVSYLTQGQINDVEYSDTYARFKARSLMKEYGIRGTRNGKDPKNPKKYKYYAIRIESAGREVFPLSKNKYRSTDDVFFDERSPEEVLSSITPRTSYTHKIHKELITI